MFLLKVGPIILSSCIFLSSFQSISAISTDAHLPPLIKWQGKSEQLMAKNGPLLTEFEKSLGTSTPSYINAMAYLNELVKTNPDQFSVNTIGVSAQNRAIKMLIASENGILNHDKPTLLIQAGIHSGEIDGKDAGFMLLRDIAEGKRNDILKRVNLLFIPILNVDGHERSSRFNRINQRGPSEMGFRTNAKNLNLNRDYTKLDTPGIQAITEVVNKYSPDLYIDIHVTDGADYQYDITYGYMPTFASESPAISKVLDDKFKPLLDSKLVNQGHIPGPLVFVMNKRDFKQGLAGWVATPRYSNGWGDLRNLPTILVENHSLKPYKQRVLGTYVFIDSVIDALSQFEKPLSDAVKYEKSHLPKELVVKRGYSKNPDHIAFKGIKYEVFNSKLSDHKEVRYIGEKIDYANLPIFWQKEILAKVAVPKAYYIPTEYGNIADKLKQQGIMVTQISGQYSNLHQASATKFEFDKMPFEGRMRVSAKFNYKKHKNVVLTNWYKVETSQPLGKLAVHLLQPEAVDSFFSWGDFNTIFQRTEYVENYALVPFANTMLQNNADISNKFNEKLKDNSDFKNDEQARLNWLYQQTPFYDKNYLKYPILIEK
ncbi:M14 family metallopeptidase [Pseudoalteromonas denitrificans]|uniref:Zinc carboxypeptidase n=1 Tax=Pseudoalteromonas denitrificans DSM 6059 TaxID=1123010 RepID=A0A1I1PAR6_9GAMM|nr:M14 family metallopeptidase [Pseudoalteromonas denitrificans]SFD06825.1 Zinc carboxypeptidase [Pseudoalteromonas denitrificans DSM 6059]